MSSKLSHTTNNRLAYLASVLMMGALILSACMSAPISASAAVELPPKELAAPAEVAVTASASEATISVATDPKLGKILVGDKGMTLYVFKKDGPDQSNCGPDCQSSWPPLLTQGNPTLGEGVDASLVGTATLSDGSKIVTYNKMPLYSFVGDTKPGDTTGQGIANLWYVISPEGKPVDNDSAGESAAPVATTAPAVTAAPGPMTTTTTTVEPSISIATEPKLGQILVGDKGMTLYIFTKDGPDQSNCSAACLQKWHPVTTEGNPTLGAGLDASMFGTATLADGTKVLTFNKKPLYYFVGDSKAGDTKGEGFAGFWFVISPLGKVVPLPTPIPTPKPSNGGMGGGGYHY
jgi:predicted lipoprotein with Yx(FWY)xxD motif